MKVLERVVGFLAGRKASNKVFAVLSPVGSVKDEIGIVCELFKNGLQIYHLRKPRWSRERVAAWVKQIPDEFRSRIVLHQFPELVSVYGLGGFHFGFGTSIPENISVACSARCEGYSDIERVGNFCRYVMLGPIFPQEDRDITVPARTPKEFSAIAEFWRKRNGKAKILAFGGINADNVKLCKKLGFDGFAAVGAIWDAKEGPVKAFKALNKKW